MKSKPFYTTTLLFNMAAVFLHNKTSLYDGDHMSMITAVKLMREKHKFPISAWRRACRILDHIYESNHYIGFGKQYSESLDPYAVANVIRNRDNRVTALLLAGEVARSPIRVKIKRVDTAPIKSK
jgi:hypothetical protein